MKRKQQIAAVMAVVFFAVFLTAAIVVISYFGESQKQETAFQKLENIAEQVAESAPCRADSSGETDDKDGLSVSGYEALSEKNSDFWGWIKIEGTQLSYPVMYTPDDPEHYLHRDFEGNYSTHGVPFLDGACSDDCGNYIIYGHHMKDGTMFGSLISYAKKDYWEAHPIIQLNTSEGQSTYIILAVFCSKVYNQEDSGVFRYYQYTDLTDSDLFNEYLEQVKTASIYDTGVDTQPGDQLLTLSTCSYHTEGGRFVVVAQKQESTSMEDKDERKP